MKRLILILLLLCTPLYGAEYTAASTSYADVNTALGNCSAGDTLIIPAGSSTWSSTLAVDGGIAIRGAGPTSTVITLSGSTLIRWNDDDSVESVNNQISQLGLVGHSDGSTVDYGIYVNGLLSNVVIHDCHISGFGYAGITFERTDGGAVIYDCIFNDNYAPGYGYGVAVLNDQEWEDPLTLGGSNAVFVEDCVFGGSLYGQRHSIAANYGAKFVFRYNIVTKTQGQNSVIDAHGQRSAITRGTRSWEVYENTVTETDNPDDPHFFDVRGGDGVCFDNVFSGMDSYYGITLKGESKSNFGGSCPWIYPDDYPAFDQCTDGYFYDNTHNGAPFTLRLHASCGYSDMYVLNEDYSLSAKDGYVAYAYPHPLRDFAPPPPGDWLVGWYARKEITIQNANIDDDLGGFPLYVEFVEDTDIGALTQADGDDIRFTSSDGSTELNFEELSFVDAGANATGYYYVKTDLTTSGGGTIYLYYGNDAASDGSDADNTWAAAYKGVWHLTESGDGSDDEFIDSSGNANHGTGGGNEGAGDGGKTPAQDTGNQKFGPACNDFDGVDNIISCGNDSSLNPSDKLSISFWANLDVFAAESFPTPVGRGYGSTWTVFFRQTDVNCRALFEGGADMETTKDDALIAVETWYHVAAVYDKDLGGGEGLEIDQSDANDYWASDANTCQKLDIDSTYTVSKVSIDCYNGSSGTSHIEFWTDEVMAGSQIGGDSDTETVSEAWIDFTWSSDDPELTSDCFMHIVEDSGATVLAANTDETKYVDTNYDLWRNGSEISGDHDLSFQVYKVASGDSGRLYVDGVEEITADVSTAMDVVAKFMWIGDDPDALDEFDGKIQEVRVANTYWIAAWVKFEHANINEGDNEITLGQEDSRSSTTYYVDATSGSDSNGGEAADDALQTISKINGMSFIPGDNIYFKEGEEWLERLTVPSSGSSGHPITFGSYGSGAKPIITVVDETSGWGTGGNWTDFESDLVTNGDFASVTATGAELITNGNMESDSEWIARGTPSTEEQSTDQAHGGSNSWKIITDGDWEGIESTTNMTIDLGKTYCLDWWVYCIDEESLYADVSDDTAKYLILLFGFTATLNDWANIKHYGQAEYSDSNQTIILRKDAAGGNGTFYYDDVSLKEVTFDSWTQGTGWGPQCDDADYASFVLLNKAHKTAGTASNLEQTGLAAEAGWYYKIVWTVSDRTAGTVQAEFGSSSGSSQSTNDTFTEYVTASDTDYFKIKADSSFDGTIDDVAVYKAAATNVWYIQSIASDPGRMWLDGTEYLAAADAVSVDATSRFWWDDPNDYLYVYATQNPADEYSTMTVSDAGTNHMAVSIVDKSYLTFSDLDIRGGKWGVMIETSAPSSDMTGLIFDACAIGKYTWQVGLWAWADTDSYNITYGEIKNCTVDSGMTLSYTLHDNYSSNGISIGEGCQYWKVYSNTIQDWYHNCITIGSSTANRETQYNEFYLNTMTAPNTTYCRGFSTDGPDDSCHHNYIYRNLIQDTTVRNQISGDYNEVYYNIIDTVTQSTYYGIVASAQGIDVEDLSVSNNCHHNKVYNNVIFNCDEPGIRVRENVAAGGEVENNEVINNIIMNCGNSSEESMGDVQMYIDDTGGGGAVGGNTYRNNHLYKSGITDVVEYRGTLRTIAEFNGETGNNSDTMADNQGGDPLMVNPGSEDFTLQAGSPCIGVGIFLGLYQDYAGNPIPLGHAPDIGAYESKHARAVIFEPWEPRLELNNPWEMN